MLIKACVILCPTIKYNEAYQKHSCVWGDPEGYVVSPGERLTVYLQAFYKLFQGTPTLYIIDNCNVSKALMKKKDVLLELPFSGHHVGQSVWVLAHK